MAFALLLVFALVCYGWGRCATKLCYGKHSEAAPAFEIALGIAVLAALGGLLNLFYLARPVSLYTMSAIGLALSLIFIRQQTKGLDWRAMCTKLSRPQENPELLAYVPHCVLCVIAAFLCINLVPTAALNTADDMHTYAVRPIHMLATGSVGGNPFDMLGLDSLGAQSFFQSFFLLVSPLSWANAFDAVFCFTLAGFLILTIARQLKVPWYFSLLAVITFVSINPQFMNISSLYSGTALILASFIACAKLAEALDATQSPAIWKQCLPLALIVASLLTLKNTFLLLLIVQMPLFFGVLALGARSWRPVIVSAGVTAVTIAFALFPWVAVTLITYGFPAAWPGHDFAPTPLMNKYPSLAAHDMASLFKMRQLFYGGNQLTYTSLAVCIAVSGIMVLLYPRAKLFCALGSHTTPFAAAALGAFGGYCLNAHMNDALTAVRYACPILIAVFPVAALILTRLFAAESRSDSGSNSPPAFSPSPFRIVPILLPIAVILLFLPLSFTRFNMALNARTILCYPIRQSYLDYNAYALGLAGVRVRALQDQTERGETILAWAAHPFQFDFKRNRVLHVSDPGLVNPLLRFPAGVTEPQLRQYLQAQGIRYILHQFDGPGMLTPAEIDNWLNYFPLHRKIAEYHIYFKGALLKICATSRVLYRDDHTVLFDLNARDEQTVTQR